jgi:hypothetical protein
MLSLMLVLCLWMFWVCLYPLTALAGFATMAFAIPLVRRVFPPDPVFTFHLLPVLAGYAAGIAALVIVSRIEYRLARYSIYRISRFDRFCLQPWPFLSSSSQTGFRSMGRQRYISSASWVVLGTWPSFWGNPESCHHARCCRGNAFPTVEGRKGPPVLASQARSDRTPLADQRHVFACSGNGTRQNEPCQRTLAKKRLNVTGTVARAAATYARARRHRAESTRDRLRFPHVERGADKARARCRRALPPSWPKYPQWGQRNAPAWRRRGR